MSRRKSNNEAHSEVRNLRFLIVGCFVIVTIGLVAVLWSFISSLQENSEKMTSYKAGNAWFGAKVQMPDAVDKSFLPTSAEQDAFKKSNEIYDDAEELAMKGEYKQAIVTGKAALKELEKEIEKQKDDGAQPGSSDATGSNSSNSSNSSTGSNSAPSSGSSPDSSKSTDGLSLGSFETRTSESQKKSGDAVDSAGSAKSAEAKMIDTIASFADKAGDGKKGSDDSRESALAGISTAAKAKGEVIQDKSSPNDKILSGRHAFLAKLYCKTREFQKAVDEYTQAIKLTPTSPPLFSSRSDVYRSLGDASAAQKDANHAYYLNQHVDGRQRAIDRILGGASAE